MKDQYDQTIEYRGRLYRYDPDFDCFYPYTEPTITNRRRWQGLALLVMIALAIAIVEL